MNLKQLVDVYAVMKLSEKQGGDLVGKSIAERVCDWHLSDFMHLRDTTGITRPQLVDALGKYIEAWWDMCDQYEFASPKYRGMFLDYVACSEASLICAEWTRNNRNKITWRNQWHSKHDTTPLGVA